MRYEYPWKITKMQSKIGVWALEWQNLGECSWGLLSTEIVVLGLQGAAAPPAHRPAHGHWFPRILWQPQLPNSSLLTYQTLSLLQRRHHHWLIKILAHCTAPRQWLWQWLLQLPTKKCVFISVSPVTSNPHGFLIIRGFSLVQQHVVKQSL